MKNTTPVPNILFDSYLKELKLIELKILLVIIRQTLGWADKKTKLGRKEHDWISGSQLRLKTGGSKRAISMATENLVAGNFIKVMDDKGNTLDSAPKRKGKIKLFYRLSKAVDISVENPMNSYFSNAKNALYMSKKVSELAQKMRITKETLQN